MSVIISPSILGGKFSNMEKVISDLDKSKAEYIHFDVMDGDFVPNLTFGPQFISNLRGFSKKVFDVHLMINRVGKFISEYLNAGADLITFHIEIDENINDVINIINSAPVLRYSFINFPTRLIIKCTSKTFFEKPLKLEIN